MKNNLIQALADYVTSNASYKQAEPAYVSVYRQSQHFGGPEEGGWWYDRVTLEGSVAFPSREQAEAYLEQAKAFVEQANRDEAPVRARAYASLPDEDETPCPANCPEGYIPTGWSDGGDLIICVEEIRGERDNSREPTPHYE